jgi:hypothetical protein
MIRTRAFVANYSVVMKTKRSRTDSDKIIHTYCFRGCRVQCDLVPISSALHFLLLLNALMDSLGKL